MILPPIRSCITWGLGPANLDTVFNSLELEVRSSVAEVKGLDQGILSLEGELELALRQREHALNALASMSLARSANSVSDSDVHIRKNSPAIDVVREPVVSMEPQLQMDEQHADQGQPMPWQNGSSHAVQRSEDIEAAPQYPVLTGDPKYVPARGLRPTTAPCSNTEEQNPSPTLNADDVKKRLLQVLRHLRDTAAFCREIPDLDRGFSNMLKKTYKELYDSLKELTSKSSGSRPANDATAPRPAPGGASTARQATAQPDAETQAPNSTQRAPGPVAVGSASTGAFAQPTSSRDLSALARLIHAKRLHQQADGAAARDPDQAPVRRIARATCASRNSRQPTLYDGLPPTRVAVGPSQGAPTGPSALQPATSEPAADADPNSQTQPQAVLGVDAADASMPETARMPSPTRKCMNSEGGETVFRQTAARESGAGLSTTCRVTESLAGSNGGVNNISSPARQMLQHARTSGAGLALILLSKTAHPLGPVVPHSEGRAGLFQEGAQGHPATQAPAIPNGASNACVVGATGGAPVEDGYYRVVAHGVGAETQTCGRVVARADNSTSSSVNGRGLLAGKRIKRTIGMDKNASLKSVSPGRKRQHVGDAQLPQA
ncbi:hypothetical protein VaNZ11_011504 [Volvox africanus]|uniref:Uncharacterized protein n=1 Tax=Volvox africanus TaxID=51714 RepID=A0ABQ5SBJ4_9CHLO|nr:hypothetical protein VaNZ11_011504 [Volvox africanus]